VPYGPLATRGQGRKGSQTCWTSRWGESRFGRGPAAWQGKELLCLRMKIDGRPPVILTTVEADVSPPP
jgi:hypothetical protein